MPRAFLFLLLLHAAALHAEEAVQASTLTGTWSGRWTDSRKEYGGSGGAFTCEAHETEAETTKNCWLATFSLGKSRHFKIRLKAQNAPDDKTKDAVIFSGAEDLGGSQGIYIWHGKVTGALFTGDYQGPGEVGTFKLIRDSK